MNCIQEISTLSEYKTWVKESIENNENVKVFFYRGHGNKAYEMQPSAYRVIDGKSYRDSEYHLFQDMLHRNPSAFSEDKTIFEKLIRMQHYGLPTRLLDVTESSSVALFFACNQECENMVDGQVFFLGIEQPKKVVNYGNAIQASSLAGLNIELNLSNVGIYTLEKMMAFIDARISSLYPTKYDIFDNTFNTLLITFKIQLEKIKNAIDYFEIVNAFRFIENYMNSILNSLQEQLRVVCETEKNQNEKTRILHARIALTDFISAYYGYTKNIITTLCENIGIPYSYNWNDSLGEFIASFTYFTFVYPPLNIERIRRQQGAFIIFPPVKSNWTFEMYQTLSNIVMLSVKIKAESKKNLLSELAHAGVTEDYLFPELDKQAKAACLRYPMTPIQV